jgi:hypothetical protein
MRFEYPSLRQGLVGAWCPSLGGGAIRLRDESGYGNHASATDFPCSAISGGNAISGNGTSSVATLSDTSALRITTGTLAGWFRIAAQGAASRCIFAGYQQTASVVSGVSVGINIATTSQNQLAAVIGKNTGAGTSDFAIWQTSVNVADSILHSFAMTLDASNTVQFYVDGVAVTTSLAAGRSAQPAVYAAASNARIGAETSTVSGTTKRWPGLLDDIRLYSRVLTLAQIRLLASRRGIGLQPMPDRAVSLPRKLFVNVGGTWRDGDAYVNVGGTWKLGTPFVNAGGTWK